MWPESTNSTGIRPNEIELLWERGKEIAVTAWARTSERWRVRGGLFLLLLGTTSMIAYSNLHHVAVPHLRLEYGDDASPHGPVAAPSSTAISSFRPKDSPYNVSKVALLIEDRALPSLAPLLLHFISVVPPDWRFRFMGSPESVAWVNGSTAVRSQVDAGKLDLTYIPTNMSTKGQEMISRFLTNLWLYETVLRPAEWLLVFQTDSILCANSRQNLNDFMDYDWVGAPWRPNGRFGGNGGLSLRRVSAIIEVLREQVRVDGSEPEDVWLTERLGHRPGARMANGSLSLIFSGETHAGQGVQAYRPPTSPASEITTGETSTDEKYYIEGIDDWREGFYEPMGYHTGSSGSMLHGGIWGDPRLRQHIWDYCPEVKMTLAMDAAKYVPGDCNANWKRDNEGVDGGFIGIEDLGHGTEIINGVVYPILPPNLTPW